MSISCLFLWNHIRQKVNPVPRFSLPMSRLRPIFDAIDDEKYDFAVKICNKAIKKDPNAKDILTIQVPVPH
jgi:hypothetical protein